MAAGQGARLGLGPKAFVRLGGATLIEWAVRAVRPFAGTIHVAVPADRHAEARRLLPPDVVVMAGGASRLDTLRVLAESSRARSLLVHDVVHPLADQELTDRVIAASRETGAACAALLLQGSVCPVQAEAIGTTIGAAVDGPLWLIQKPAVVPRAALLHGLELNAAAPGREGTGTLDLVARAGVRAVVVAGDPVNIKITDSADLRLAERLAPAWPGWT